MNLLISINGVADRGAVNVTVVAGVFSSIFVPFRPRRRHVVARRRRACIAVGTSRVHLVIKRGELGRLIRHPAAVNKGRFRGIYCALERADASRRERAVTARYTRRTIRLTMTLKRRPGHRLPGVAPPVSTCFTSSAYFLWSIAR